MSPVLFFNAGNRCWYFVPMSYYGCCEPSGKRQTCSSWVIGLFSHPVFYERARLMARLKLLVALLSMVVCATGECKCLFFEVRRRRVRKVVCAEEKNAFGLQSLVLLDSKRLCVGGYPSDFPPTHHVPQTKK
jgi:hypothetical protein